MKLINQCVLDVLSRTSSLNYVGKCAANPSAHTWEAHTPCGHSVQLKPLVAFTNVFSAISNRITGTLAFLSGFRWGHQKAVDKQISHPEFPYVSYIFGFENQCVFSSWHFMASKIVTSPIEIVTGSFFACKDMTKSIDDLSMKRMS